jgi:hypothetical protein
MKLLFSSILAGLALATPAFAQPPTQPTDTQTTTQPADTTRMPWERGFWGHAGISFGQFSNIFGLEIGAMNFGKFQGGGGETDGWGADIALLAGIPIGANSAIFGKAGVIYARTEVSGTAPGLETGKERGFGGRWGLGGQLGLTKQWALRADFDRYRLAAPGDHRDLETLMLGVQYTFR